MAKQAGKVAKTANITAFVDNMALILNHSKR